MDLFGALSLIGGLVLFIYGITTMSSSLAKVAGNKLEGTLERLAGNKYKGFALGLLVAGVIQSSTATTVMVVGFVNAGIMRLTQSVGIIIGANLGTTFTAQIIRLGDIDGGNLFLQLLRPAGLTPIFLTIGLILFLTGKHKKRRDIGSIFIGFGILFTGMLTMEGALRPLRDVEWFAQLFITFTNPLLGFVVGAVVTAILQSSTASIGILQALSTTGHITFAAAFPIILGSNVGTTVTAVLSSVGGSKNARRAAFIHLFYNVAGAALFLALVLILRPGNFLPFWDHVVDRGMIADAHAVYNVMCALIALPISKIFVKLANWAVRVGPDELEDDLLSDENFANAPNRVAIEYARKAIVKMAGDAKRNLADVKSLTVSYDAKVMQRVMETETSLDRMEIKLGNALVNLANRGLSLQENIAVTELLNVVNDIERIGDYAVNVAESAAQLASDGAEFSPMAQHELAILLKAISRIMDVTIDCFISRNRNAIVLVEPHEEVIDVLTESIKARHIERLKIGACTIDAGTVLLEMLISLERIADHCSNIAIAVSRTYGAGASYESYDPHDQKHRLHLGENEEYNEIYNNLLKQFMDELNGASFSSPNGEQMNLELP